MNDLTNLNELTEKLKDFYKTPEGELYILKVRKKFEIYNNRKKRLWVYLESLSNDAFEELIQKFIKWENDFEEQEEIIYNYEDKINLYVFVEENE